MTTVIDLLNSAVTFLFDLLLWPFAFLNPIWGLLFLSILGGIALLLIYGRISNQKAIKDSKRRIYSHILESVLFRHDVKTSLKAQAGMFRAGLKYFALAIPPILVLMIPCLIILAQLNLRYNSTGLSSEESSILEVVLNGSSRLFEVSAESSPGVTLSPPLRDVNENKIFWRMDLEPDINAAEAQLTINTPSEALRVPLYIGSENPKIVSNRNSKWWWRFFYPGDSVLNGSQDLVKEISASYPEVSYNVLGVKMHWLVVFLVASIVSGIIGSRIFKVEI